VFVAEHYQVVRWHQARFTNAPAEAPNNPVKARTRVASLVPV
jgi:hypothetical protein